MNAKIEVKEMPKMELAYVTHIGNPDKLNIAYQQLIRWATPKGLMDAPDVKLLTIYHDSLKVTDPEKVRMSACIILNNLIEASDEIDTIKLEPGKCIVGHFTIGHNDFEKSWSSLYIWMDEHGYVAAGLNPFEIYHNNYNEHPEKKFIVDFFIPIQ